jgi:hypothetical protein
MRKFFIRFRLWLSGVSLCGHEMGDNLYYCPVCVDEKLDKHQQSKERLRSMRKELLGK